MISLYRTAVLLLGTILSFTAAGADIEVGSTLPSLTVTDLGECVIVDGETAYQPWDSSALLGSVQILEHVPARAGVDEINRPFFEALEASGLPANAVRQTTVVNSDDAVWGTSGLVAGEVSKNKLANPAVTLVVDAGGLARKQWQLEEKTAALAILDARGEVLFFREGGLSEAEIEEAIALLRSKLAAGEADAEAELATSS